MNTGTVLKPCGLCWARGTAWKEKMKCRLGLSSQLRRVVKLSMQGGPMKKAREEAALGSSLTRRKSPMPGWKTLCMSCRHSVQSIKDTKQTLAERTELSNHSLGVLLKQVCPAFVCLQILRDTPVHYQLVKTKVKGRSSSKGEDSISPSQNSCHREHKGQLSHGVLHLLTQACT